MKRIVLLLILCLLLSGCGTQTPVASEDPTPPPSSEQQVEAIGLYDPNSPVEKATNGAVRAYLLGDGEYVGILNVNGQVLVISADGTAAMLRGNNCEIVATAAVDLPADYAPIQLCANNNTIAYYASESRQIVLLDTMLQELVRVDLPAEAYGNPVILLDQQEVFYCIGNEIRGMNLQTGISRLVRSHTGTSQELIGSYFNGNLIGCRVTDEYGQLKNQYFYSQTGLVVHTDTNMGALTTVGQDYFAIRNDGSTRQILFGNADGETMCLNLTPNNLIPTLPLGGVVQYDTVNRDLHLNFYDFASGNRSGEVVIQEAEHLQSSCSDQQYLWLLCGQTLYRWDPSASDVDDETIYTGNLYTADNPDTAGLAQCIQQAAELGDTYGISIQVWEDAANHDYSVVTEYQTSVIRNTLERLEAILEKLPKEFYATTGNLTVNLVRQVNGERNAIQFRTGSTFSMVIPCEDVEQYFLWGLGWAVDTRVLGNSREYDFWGDLNPNDFDYTYDYTLNSYRQDADIYAHAFANLDAMSFPSEDRASIFAAAILPGNDQLFAGEILQKKLSVLCDAIREAYGLDDRPEAFPWEQYLEKPLAKNS